MRTVFLSKYIGIVKTVLAIFIAALALYFSGTPVQAQGTYSCRWEGTTCEVNFAANNCSPSYEASTALCNSFNNDPAACNGAVNLACTSVGCASGLYARANGTCQCVGASYVGDTYPSLAECNAGPQLPTCIAPEVEMCNLDDRCICINGEQRNCGGFGELSCFSYYFTAMRSRYCEPGLSAIQATGTNRHFCVNTQEEADQAHSGMTFEDQPSFNLCQQAARNGESPTECIDCANRGGVWTAIGCIPTTRSELVGVFLTLAISISGGIVLLRVLQAAFMLSTSQGEQNKVQEARDILTSSIGGLLFLLFSMVLLNTIGVNILQIPDF